MKPLYTAVVTTRGGRQGRAISSDGVLDLKLAPPTDGGGTNPEQLFAAGYAACFESALRLVAKEAGTPINDASITAHVTLNVSEPRQFDLSVELHGQAEGLSASQTEDLMHKAHALCPYSRATRGNVEVKLFAEDYAGVPA